MEWKSLALRVLIELDTVRIRAQVFAQHATKKHLTYKDIARDILRSHGKVPVIEMNMLIVEGRLDFLGVVNRTTTCRYIVSSTHFVVSHSTCHTAGYPENF